MHASPSAALTAVTDRVLAIRPSIAQRTASLRSLPRSTQPRISVLIPAGRVPQDVLQGVTCLAEESVRGNVAVVGEVPEPRVGGGVWVVG